MKSRKHSFRKEAIAALANERLQESLKKATTHRMALVEQALGELGDPDWYREMVRRIKNHTLANLETYLEQLAVAVERRGGVVHWAGDAADARTIIAGIVRNSGASLAVKSKSMTSEEIELNRALEAEGVEVVETDLGEFILQLDGDRPSHIVTPMIHKSRSEVARLFSQKLGMEYSEDPPQLTAKARSYLREKFRRADVGITGVNLAVAETGTLCILTNEGNGRMATSVPRVRIALMGMEKVIPTLLDLGIVLKLLTKAATAQRLCVYATLDTGPRRRGERDGPEEFHLVILDNGRSAILGGEYREILRCVRCGACLNVCPVYRKVGGHAYGSVYPGPIGSVLSPLFHGLGEFEELPHASTLCGACQEICCARIPIPEMLIRLKRDQNERGLLNPGDAAGFSAWTWAWSSPFRYRITTRFFRIFARAISRRGWLKWLPGPGGGWTKVRDLPAPAKVPFREKWEKQCR